jgi:hypothetical protein
MTRRRLVALFLGWHLFAISVAALPPASRASNFPPRDPSAALNPSFHQLTLLFDAAARAADAVERVIRWGTRPLRPLATSYLRLTGLSQTWSMFANPPTTAQYMRVRYYVQPREGREWAATELVWPTNREDRLRTFQSFRDSYRDKALAVAVARFYDRRKTDVIRPDTQPDDLPNDLAPVARYFTKRFAAGYITNDGDRVVRTEIWIGNAPIPRLGTSASEDARLARAEALQAYYDGLIEHRLQVPPRPPYHGGEREADIGWLLEYFEEP